MPECTRLNCSGLPQYHLRRIGPAATVQGVADIMDFHKVTTLIGRNRSQVDYVLESSAFIRSMYISRNHARLVRQVSNSDAHRLFDDSLNGLFVNDIKIAGSIVLGEGDLVTFGHPKGAEVPSGVRTRQPDSEYQFLFERCNCSKPENGTVHARGGQFVVPKSKAKSSKKKRDRNKTETFTSEDVRKLRESYEAEVKSATTNGKLGNRGNKTKKSSTATCTSSNASETSAKQSDPCPPQKDEIQDIEPDKDDAAAQTEEKQDDLDSDDLETCIKTGSSFKGKHSPTKDASMQTTSDADIPSESFKTPLRNKSPMKDASMQTSPDETSARHSDRLRSCEADNFPPFDVSANEVSTETAFEMIQIGSSNETVVKENEEQHSVQQVNHLAGNDNNTNDDGSVHSVQEKCLKNEESSENVHECASIENEGSFIVNRNSEITIEESRNAEGQMGENVEIETAVKDEMTTEITMEVDSNVENEMAREIQMHVDEQGSIECEMTREIQLEEQWNESTVGLDMAREIQTAEKINLNAEELNMTSETEEKIIENTEELDTTREIQTDEKFIENFEELDTTREIQTAEKINLNAEELDKTSETEEKISENTEELDTTTGIQTEEKLSENAEELDMTRTIETEEKINENAAELDKTREIQTEEKINENAVELDTTREIQTEEKMNLNGEEHDITCETEEKVTENAVELDTTRDIQTEEKINLNGEEHDITCETEEKVTENAVELDTTREIQTEEKINDNAVELDMTREIQAEETAHSDALELDTTREIQAAEEKINSNVEELEIQNEEKINESDKELDVTRILPVRDDVDVFTLKSKTKEVEDEINQKSLLEKDLKNENVSVESMSCDVETSEQAVSSNNTDKAVVETHKTLACEILDNVLKVDGHGAASLNVENEGGVECDDTDESIISPCQKTGDDLNVSDTNGEMNPEEVKVVETPAEENLDGGSEKEKEEGSAKIDSDRNGYDSIDTDDESEEHEQECGLISSNSIDYQPEFYDDESDGNVSDSLIDEDEILREEKDDNFDVVGCESDVRKTAVCDVEEICIEENMDCVIVSEIESFSENENFQSKPNVHNDIESEMNSLTENQTFNSKSNEDVVDDVKNKGSPLKQDTEKLNKTENCESGNSELNRMCEVGDKKQSHACYGKSGSVLEDISDKMNVDYSDEIDGTAASQPLLSEVCSMQVEDSEVAISSKSRETSVSVLPVPSQKIGDHPNIIQPKNSADENSVIQKYLDEGVIESDVSEVSFHGDSVNDYKNNSKLKGHDNVVSIQSTITDASCHDDVNRKEINVIEVSSLDVDRNKDSEKGCLVDATSEVSNATIVSCHSEIDSRKGSMAEVCSLDEGGNKDSQEDCDVDVNKVRNIVAVSCHGDVNIIKERNVVESGSHDEVKNEDSDNGCDMHVDIDNKVRNNVGVSCHGDVNRKYNGDGQSYLDCETGTDIVDGIKKEMEESDSVLKLDDGVSEYDENRNQNADNVVVSNKCLDKISVAVKSNECEMDRNKMEIALRVEESAISEDEAGQNNEEKDGTAMVCESNIGVTKNIDVHKEVESENQIINVSMEMGIDLEQGNAKSQTVEENDLKKETSKKENIQNNEQDRESCSQIVEKTVPEDNGPCLIELDVKVTVLETENNDLNPDKKQSSESIPSCSEIDTRTMSPISKNMSLLQDFSRSLSPFSKSGHSMLSAANLSTSAFVPQQVLSPVSRRKMDQADISEMVSCLEESISSTGEISDSEDKADDVDLQEIPAVFILDKSLASANDSMKEKTSTSKDDDLIDQNGNSIIPSFRTETVNFAEFTNDHMTRNNVNAESDKNLDKIMDCDKLADEMSFSCSREMKQMQEKENGSSPECFDMESSMEILKQVSGNKSLDVQDGNMNKISECMQDNCIELPEKVAAALATNDFENSSHLDIEKTENCVNEEKTNMDVEHKDSGLDTDENEYMEDKVEICDLDVQKCVTTNEKFDSGESNIGLVNQSRIEDKPVLSLVLTLRENAGDGVNNGVDEFRNNDDEDNDDDDNYEGLSQVYPVMAERRDVQWDKNLDDDLSVLLTHDSEDEIDEMKNTSFEKEGTSVNDTQHVNEDETTDSQSDGNKSENNQADVCFKMNDSVKSDSASSANVGNTHLKMINNESTDTKHTSESNTSKIDSFIKMNNEEIVEIGEVNKDLTSQVTDRCLKINGSVSDIIEHMNVDDTCKTDSYLEVNNDVTNEIKQTTEIKTCQANTGLGNDEDKICRKRKFSEVINEDESDLPCQKKVCSESKKGTIDKIKNVLSNFFSIRKKVRESNRLNSKTIKKQLIGRLVKHFFKTGSVTNDTTVTGVPELVRKLETVPNTNGSEMMQIEYMDTETGRGSSKSGENLESIQIANGLEMAQTGNTDIVVKSGSSDSTGNSKTIRVKNLNISTDISLSQSVGCLGTIQTESISPDAVNKSSPSVGSSEPVMTESIRVRGETCLSQRRDSLETVMSENSSDDAETNFSQSVGSLEPVLTESICVRADTSLTQRRDSLETVMSENSSDDAETSFPQSVGCLEPVMAESIRVQADTSLTQRRDSLETVMSETNFSQRGGSVETVLSENSTTHSENMSVDTEIRSPQSVGNWKTEQTETFDSKIGSSENEGSPETVQNGNMDVDHTEILSSGLGTAVTEQAEKMSFDSEIGSSEHEGSSETVQSGNMDVDTAEKLSSSLGTAEILPRQNMDASTENRPSENKVINVDTENGSTEDTASSSKQLETLSCIRDTDTEMSRSILEPVNVNTDIKIVSYSNATENDVQSQSMLTDDKDTISSSGDVAEDEAIDYSTSNIQAASTQIGDPENSLCGKYQPQPDSWKLVYISNAERDSPSTCYDSSQVGSLQSSFNASVQDMSSAEMQVYTQEDKVMSQSPGAMENSLINQSGSERPDDSSLNSDSGQKVCQLLKPLKVTESQELDLDFENTDEADDKNLNIEDDENCAECSFNAVSNRMSKQSQISQSNHVINNEEVITDENRNDSNIDDTQETVADFEEMSETTKTTTRPAISNLSMEDKDADTEVQNYTSEITRSSADVQGQNGGSDNGENMDERIVGTNSELQSCVDDNVSSEESQSLLVFPSIQSYVGEDIDMNENLENEGVVKENSEDESSDQNKVGAEQENLNPKDRLELMKTLGGNLSAFTSKQLRVDSFKQLEIKDKARSSEMTEGDSEQTILDSEESGTQKLVEGRTKYFNDSDIEIFSLESSINDSPGSDAEHLESSKYDTNSKSWNQNSELIEQECGGRSEKYVDCSEKLENKEETMQDETVSENNDIDISKHRDLSASIQESPLDSELTESMGREIDSSNDYYLRMFGGHASYSMESMEDSEVNDGKSGSEVKMDSEKDYYNSESNSHGLESEFIGTQSRLPDMEAESENNNNTLVTKTEKIKPPMIDIDSDSDLSDLPEVIFLRKEEPTTSQQLKNTKQLVKQEVMSDSDSERWDRQTRTPKKKSPKKRSDRSTSSRKSSEKKNYIKRELVTDSDSENFSGDKRTTRKISPRKRVKKTSESPKVKVKTEKAKETRSKRKSKKKGKLEPVFENSDIIVITESDTDSEEKIDKSPKDTDCDVEKVKVISGMNTDSNTENTGDQSTTEIDSDVMEKVKDTDIMDIFKDGSIQDMFNSEEFDDNICDAIRPDLQTNTDTDKSPEKDSSNSPSDRDEEEPTVEIKEVYISYNEDADHSDDNIDSILEQETQYFGSPTKQSTIMKDGYTEACPDVRLSNIAEKGASTSKWQNDDILYQETQNYGTTGEEEATLSDESNTENISPSRKSVKSNTGVVERESTDDKNKERSFDVMDAEVARPCKNDVADTTFNSEGESNNDTEFVENTCGSESDSDMYFPVLRPLSPAGNSLASSSPVVSDQNTGQVGKGINFGKNEIGGQRLNMELSCNFDDDEDDFSPPILDMAALGNNESDHHDNSLGSESRTDVTQFTFVKDRSTLQTNESTVIYSYDQDETLANESHRKRRLTDDESINETYTPKKRSKSGDVTSSCSISRYDQNGNHEQSLSLDMEVSTQLPIVSDLSDTQFHDTASDFLSQIKRKGTPTKKNKAKALLEKLKARRNKLKAQQKDKNAENIASSSGQENVEFHPPSNVVAVRTQAEQTNDNIDSYVARCNEVVCRLKESLNSRPDLQRNPRLVQWKEEAFQLEKKAKLPETVIAVVGDTGSGKSSLMNAVIDQLDVLPTSGVRACTAVVVEITDNKKNDMFEADVKFLSRKEWFDELKLLLTDLTGPDGKIKKHVPDPQSEAGVAYLKIKAVYGKIDTFENLSRYHVVTKWLDKTRTITSRNAKEFRKLIDRYIETSDPGIGGQYWPIVKLVTMRIPNCDVCSSGAVLVDLPGVRDSNAARDKIARDYLKKCTAVWVVSSIHRAIDDKTAKDLLGENFRRQLLMDGQYGSIAFICTKSDILVPSEIIQGLKLQDKTDPLENEIKGLQMEKADADLTLANTKQEIKQLKSTVKQLQEEIRELNQDLDAIQELNDSMDQDEDSEIQQQIKESRDDLLSKEESVRLTESDIKEKELTVNDANRRSLEIEKEISFRRKEIATICAKGRNEYARREIKRDFKAGLREMKRKAGMTVEEEDEDMADDYDSDNDDEDIGSTADNLKVFCVSSVEYQKIKKILANNGPATVFNTMEDTEILSLRAFVHEMTSRRRQQGSDRMINNISRFVFDIQNYLMDNGTECKGTRMSARSAIEGRASELQERFEPVIQRLTDDIDEAFNGSIRPRMEEGVTNACSSAMDVQEKWARKSNRENRKEGGLHHSTYKATVRRQGVYGSPTYGAIDMNEELSQPLYRSITIMWDKVFSGMLWNALERCRSMLLGVLRLFTTELCNELHSLGVPQERTQRVNEQLLNSAATKLTEMVAYLKEFITSSQRDISRVLTPVVQENLTNTYDDCASQAGTGMFNRMKGFMASGVDKKRFCMFDEASTKLLNDLLELQSQIVEHIYFVCKELCKLLQSSFEPLWEAPVNTKILREALFDSITDMSLTMTRLQEDANLPPLERALVPVSAPQTASTHDSGASNHPSSSTIGSSSVPPVANEITVSTTVPPNGELLQSDRGQQVHAVAYSGLKKIITDLLGQPQNISFEEQQTSYSSDLSSHVKGEPMEEGETQYIKQELNLPHDSGYGSSSARLSNGHVTVKTETDNGQNTSNNGLCLPTNVQSTNMHLNTNSHTMNSLPAFSATHLLTGGSHGSVCQQNRNLPSGNCRTYVKVPTTACNNIAVPSLTLLNRNIRQRLTGKITASENNTLSSRPISAVNTSGNFSSKSLGVAYSNPSTTLPSTNGQNLIGINTSVNIAGTSRNISTTVQGKNYPAVQVIYPHNTPVLSPADCRMIHAQNTATLTRAQTAPNCQQEPPRQVLVSGNVTTSSGSVNAGHRTVETSVSNPASARLYSFIQQQPLNSKTVTGQSSSQHFVVGQSGGLTSQPKGAHTVISQSSGPTTVKILPPKVVIGQPNRLQSVTAQSTGIRHVIGQSVGIQPLIRPVIGQTYSIQSNTGQTTGIQPVVSQPIGIHPAFGQPIGIHPATGRPIQIQTISSQSVVNKSVNSQSAGTPSLSRTVVSQTARTPLVSRTVVSQSAGTPSVSSQSSGSKVKVLSTITNTTKNILMSGIEKSVKSFLNKSTTDNKQLPVAKSSTSSSTNVSNSSCLGNSLEKSSQGSNYVSKVNKLSLSQKRNANSPTASRQDNTRSPIYNRSRVKQEPMDAGYEPKRKIRRLGYIDLTTASSEESD